MTIAIAGISAINLRPKKAGAASQVLYASTEDGARVFMSIPAAICCETSL
jgi:hypothetical protein